MKANRTSKIRWVSVEDRLPEITEPSRLNRNGPATQSKPVLYEIAGVVLVGTLQVNPGGGYEWVDNSGCIQPHYVQYWAGLPVAPEGTHPWRNREAWDAKMKRLGFELYEDTPIKSHSDHQLSP